MFQIFVIFVDLHLSRVRESFGKNISLASNLSILRTFCGIVEYCN